MLAKMVPYVEVILMKIEKRIEGRKY